MTVVATGDARTISVRVDSTSIENSMRVAPSAAYFRLRNFFGSVFGKHRQQWLSDKGTQFGRGDKAGRAIKVWPVNQGPVAPADNHVVYRVTPTDVRRPDAGQAAAGLREMGAEASTGNIVLPVHEFGTDIRSGRWMAIPVRTRPGSPKAWREANPGKVLITRPTKTGGELRLYEVVRTRARGRPKKGEAPRFTEKLRLRFRLVRSVDMKATLHMYDTWDRLAYYREAAWQRAVDGPMHDIEEGVVS